MEVLRHAVILSVVICVSAASYKSVKDVRSAMTTDMKYINGCYKLLNATHEIGCEAPGGVEVTAPLIHLRHLSAKPTADRAVVVPAADLETFLRQLKASPDLATHVKAVLVDSTVRPNHSSSATTFPGVNFAPYTTQYAWNPHGSGLAREYFNFPIMLMSQAMRDDATRRAQTNQDNDFKGATHHARVSLTMFAQRNSTYCIAKGTCMPLSSYSVAATLPPLTPSSSQLPITLVVAQVDGDSLFHDAVQTADSPSSGLVAMLAAMKLLSDQTASPTSFPAMPQPATRRIVFVALVGEPWDYMGSKRFLYELETGASNATRGLDLNLVDQVVEVGPVGLASVGNTSSTQLYLHTSRAAGAADATPLVSLLQASATATPSLPTTASPPSPSTPGLPPSSLTSFLRVRPNIQGVLISEFDTEFKNQHYHSEFDTADQISGTAITATAVMLARTLRAMMMGDSREMQVNVTSAQQLVSALMDCWSKDSPGLTCSLSTQLMTPGYAAHDGLIYYNRPGRYVSVASLVAANNRIILPSPQDPTAKPDFARLVWNLMAVFTATPQSPGTNVTYCNHPSKVRCPGDMVCVGVKDYNARTPSQGMGRCMNATAMYVPSWSTQFEFSNSRSTWEVSNASASWQATYSWPQDPMWTESNWPYGTPSLRVYLRESHDTEVAVLVSGLLLTAGAALASYYARRLFEKHLKSN